MKYSSSIRDLKEKNRGVCGARGSLLPSESPKFILNIIDLLRYFLFHCRTYQHFNHRDFSADVMTRLWEKPVFSNWVLRKCVKVSEREKFVLAETFY